MLHRVALHSAAAALAALSDTVQLRLWHPAGTAAANAGSISERGSGKRTQWVLHASQMVLRGYLGYRPGILGTQGRTLGLGGCMQAAAVGRAPGAAARRTGIDSGGRKLCATLCLEVVKAFGGMRGDQVKRAW